VCRHSLRKSSPIVRLQFGHERLDSAQKFACGVVCSWLSVEAILEAIEECIESPGLNDWPRDNVEVSGMKLRNKVVVLFRLNNPLKFQRKFANDV